MSVRVLVIAEDPTWNGYILKPLTQALLADAGRPAARVELLTSPRLRGYSQALKAIRNELPERYARFFDLWLFFPDADRATPDAARRLEEDIASHGITLLCCPAQPEVEIYACVGFRDDLKKPWDAIRQHPRLKEDVFQPLLNRPGVAGRVGGLLDPGVKQHRVREGGGGRRGSHAVEKAMSRAVPTRALGPVEHPRYPPGKPGSRPRRTHRKSIEQACLRLGADLVGPTVETRPRHEPGQPANHPGCSRDRARCDGRCPAARGPALRPGISLLPPGARCCRIRRGACSSRGEPRRSSRTLRRLRVPVGALLRGRRGQ